MNTGKFYLIPDIQFIWNSESEDPLVSCCGKEVNAYDLEEYMGEKFEALLKVKGIVDPKPNDFFNFVHTHAGLVRTYIEKHGY